MEPNYTNLYVAGIWTEAEKPAALQLVAAEYWAQNNKNESKLAHAQIAGALLHRVGLGYECFPASMHRPQSQAHLSSEGMQYAQPGKIPKWHVKQLESKQEPFSSHAKTDY